MMQHVTREWFTAADLAAMALPGMPTSPANIRALAERERWDRAEYAGKRWRLRREKGGGKEYHYSLLPPPARNTWIAAHTPVGEQAEWAAAQSAGSFSAGLWEGFWKAPEKKRAKALERLQVVVMIDQAVKSGRPRTNAVLEAAEEFNVGRSTIHTWLELIEGLPRQDWTPALMPRHVGRTAKSECTDEAWTLLYSLYARPGEPTFADCYRKVQFAAGKEGWTLPSEETLRRRMDKIDPKVLALARRGREAVKRMFPALERDRSVFHALQAVNADGHKWDVFVRWPDGTVHRPMMVGFQDLYSNKFLSWKIDRTENLYLVQRAFGDVVEQFGIPELCYLDNGRGFTAKALTGGIKNRFRYRYRDAEPEGIMKQLGVDVRFTLPYSGQSKPIERGFGDFASAIAKDPRFEGAYCGNKPGARPEDCDPAKAVPLDLFLRVINEGIIEHNARRGRRTKVCDGRTSFDEAFAASYAQAVIRKAPPNAKQMWLLAAQHIKPRGHESSIHFYGNRYWAEFLQHHHGAMLTVRFDPDELHTGVHIYSTDGKYLGHAPCLEAVGFADVDGAKQQAQQRGAYMKAARLINEIERNGLTRGRVAELIERNDELPPLPETKVVRLFNGNAALAVRREDEPDRDEETEAMFVRAMRNRGGLRAVPVEDADDD